MAAFQVYDGAEQELLVIRHTPKQAFDLETQNIMVLQYISVGNALDGNRIGQYAWLKMNDRFSDGALKVHPVYFRHPLARQGAYAKITGRCPDMGALGQRVRRLDAHGIEQPVQIARQDQKSVGYGKGVSVREALGGR